MSIAFENSTRCHSSPARAQPLGRALRRAPPVVCAASVLALALLVAAPAHAGKNRLSFDAGGDFATSGGNRGGWGAGLRFGRDWDLLILSLTPEASLGYHAFRGWEAACVFTAMGGARLGLDLALSPSLFAHAGLGYLNRTQRSRASLAYDVGAAVDLTSLPFVEFGPHVMWSGIAGSSSASPFSWFEVGGHLTIKLGS